MIERIDLTGRRRMIVARHGDLPVWSPNGASIAYSETSTGSDLDGNRIWPTCGSYLPGAVAAEGSSWTIR